ncbi:MAG TPA: hypothetical protein VKA67_12835, partial [Verrucomicrobiae bacterium]|nr:hypothetical protein [Verrucomicrobiae bacterium]
LEDGSGRRIQNNQLVSDPGSYEQFAIGTQRERLRPRSRKFNQGSSRCDDLIDWRYETVRLMSDCFRGRVKICAFSP